MDYPFYFYPRIKGTEVGKIPCFYYPGPKVKVVVVNDNNRHFYFDAPVEGKFLVKTSCAPGCKETVEYFEFNEENLSKLSTEVKAIYDAYEKRYLAFIDTQDYANVTSEDLTAANRALQYKPQRIFDGFENYAGGNEEDHNLVRKYFDITWITDYE